LESGGLSHASCEEAFALWWVSGRDLDGFEVGRWEEIGCLPEGQGRFFVSMAFGD